MPRVLSQLLCALLRLAYIAVEGHASADSAILEGSNASALVSQMTSPNDQGRMLPVQTPVRYTAMELGHSHNCFITSATFLMQYFFFFQLQFTLDIILY